VAGPAVESAEIPADLPEVAFRSAAGLANLAPHSMGNAMNRITAFALLMIASNAFAAEQRPMRFWNLTRHTISEFQLAPAGSTQWGENQCKNDKDGTVDSDERLRITGIRPGTYDAKLKDVSGRSCLVHNIKVEAGEVFSIEEKDLTSCDR
jgi:hypothetical protein